MATLAELSEPILAEKKTQTTPALYGWKPWELHLFRFSAIYVFLQTFPLDWKYYKQLFTSELPFFSYGYLFEVARYYPRFFSGEDTLLNWLVVGVLAAIGAYLWAQKDSEKIEYNYLYYWTRVLVRYRVSAAALVYGFLKLYALQAPEPTISQLNTPYGDLSSWKIFAMSLGIVPDYQLFLGASEIFGGLLLLYRRTATIGAFLLLVFWGNVFISNLAYEGGEAIYSLYLISLTLYLLAFDTLRLWSLYTSHDYTLPNKYHPVFTSTTKLVRTVLIAAFVGLFVIFYNFDTKAADRSYHLPQGNVHTDLQGLYKVTFYAENGEEISYNTDHPTRWSDLIVEPWGTISIRSNREVIPVELKTEQIFSNSNNRVYELSETIGRHYYTYELDEAKKELILENKNPNHASEKLILSFNRLESGGIQLTGKDITGAAIDVKLQKNDKEYLLNKVGKTGRKKQIVF